ncbi:hypothetical protein V8F06_002165 [Rhypophila decipiens]
MTRPGIIRADTIDLQDHKAPSAQDHRRPIATVGGSFAAHQAETLREAVAGTAEERLRSPRISWNNGDVGVPQHHAEERPLSGVVDSATCQQRGLQDDSDTHKAQPSTMPAGPQQDALAIAQNGGSNHDGDDGDLDDTEVDMDDDMMDKISSSPSIEDGGSTFIIASLPSPCRHHARSRAPPSPDSRSASPTISEARSSSPYLDQPDHLPLYRQDHKPKSVHPAPLVSHHHPSGKYSAAQASAEGPPLSNSNDSVTTMYGIDDDDDEPGSKKVQTCLGGGMQDDLEEESYEPGSKRYKTDKYDPARKWTSSHDSQTDGLGSPELLPTYDESELTVAYYADEEDDDDGDFSCLDDSRFLDSGWGGECLQDTEDIDFELVYALHTFVATVDGQANATKGDAMVLLDDSNSYWWLVRVVKDASIGYLPAEHIETPTERLARLNKHRNIDLSATMLGDQAEKSRNPLKSAIKRRKTKTVQFAAGEQVDYYDLDYSTEEEELEMEYFAQQQGQQAQETVSQQSSTEADAEDETAKVEPLRPRTQQKEAKTDSKKRDNTGSEPTNGVSKSRDSEEIFETKSGDGPKKSSDGIVRDSFFKDDTVETKKITLTPNLLRDDTAPRSSSDSRELKQRPSLDKLEKDNVFGKDDKKKKDKKEKDKKPGSFRSLFSRKDKKSKDDDDDSLGGKRSMDVDVAETVQAEEEAQVSPEKAPGPGPQRNPSKLQKQQPRMEPSPTRKPNTGGLVKDSGLDVQAFLSEGKLNNVSNVPPASMRVVEPDSPGGNVTRGRGLNPSAAISNASSVSDYRTPLATAAKKRIELDDFDSDEEFATPMETLPKTAAPVVSQKTEQTGYPDDYQQLSQGSERTNTEASKASVSNGRTTPPQQRAERLSESPVQVSPVTTANPPPLMRDSSSQEEDPSSPRSTPSPELVEHDEDGEVASKKDSMTTTTSATAMSWNDVSLRAFFDSSSEIRDMLVVVYDKTDVTPAGPEHPVAGTLFKEPKAALAEITTQLDNMLGDWLARKQRSRGTL